jgi:hypothetical protein
MQQDLLGPVEEKTAKAVSAYAAERGVRIVLNASVLRNGLAYVHDTADITSEIIRRIAAETRKGAPQNASLTPDAPPSTMLSDHLMESKWLDANFVRKHFLSEAVTAHQEVAEATNLETPAP